MRQCRRSGNLLGKVSKLAPRERVQNRTQEQIMDFPVPRILEAVVEVVPSLPQEHVQHRARPKSYSGADRR